MSFSENVLAQKRPATVQSFRLPRRQRYHASPADWRDEVLYFLLPDRFSDGREESRPLLKREELPEIRGNEWRFDKWAESGGTRWQGGTLKGVSSKLSYLSNLGITTIWLGPVFRQRGHLDTYHGYGIQDFLDVDPRFGTRSDLVELVALAHAQGLRVILDIIFNHSGANWLYPPGTPPAHGSDGRLQARYIGPGKRYDFGSWRGVDGTGVKQIARDGDGVWPHDLQNPEFYTRAGSGDLGAGDIHDPQAEFRRSDFYDLRDFSLSSPAVLSTLARVYKYWIALTDCDGFRIDTLKHVPFEEARNFCGTIKEFATNIGKVDFFLLGEVAGGDRYQGKYLDALDQNLNAALDIGSMRTTLSDVAKGLSSPQRYFFGYHPSTPGMGSHRNYGKRHVSVLDDHDHVFGSKIRFSADSAHPDQVVAGIAIQLFTLGIPCIYYGTEQALAGPESEVRNFIPEWGRSDTFLREAMFGPEHPRMKGLEGHQSNSFDMSLPGFGPFGTAGHHCFDEASRVYRKIAHLTSARRQFPALRSGRQYLRPLSLFGEPFSLREGGELIAWSRVLDDEEYLCVVNSHGTESRGATVAVDESLTPAGSTFTIVASTPAAVPSAPTQFQIHETLSVFENHGTAAVRIEALGPSEVLVLSNRPSPDAGGLA